jgi:hypothetical protein
MPETRKRDWLYLHGEMARVRKIIRRKNKAKEKVKQSMESKRGGKGKR